MAVIEVGGGGGGTGFFISAKTIDAVANQGENILIFKIDKAFTLTNITIQSFKEVLSTTLIVDINYNLANVGDPTDASIFTDQDNRPEILDEGFIAVSGTPDTVNLAAGALIGISIDQAGVGQGEPLLISFNGAET